jgi:hypothetical protein
MIISQDLSQDHDVVGSVFFFFWRGGGGGGGGVWNLYLIDTRRFMYFHFHFVGS